MKIGAETARQPRKIGGLDGAGWAEWVREHPMATLPPGAAKLIVDDRDARINTLRDRIVRELTLSAEEEPGDFKAAMQWHRAGKATSPTAVSVRHTDAILRHLGYET